MGSLLRSVKKRKKSRRLGEVEMVRHEDYGELALDAKVEMIRSLVPLGLMHVHELLDDEVKALVGERYSRKDELDRGRRHGSNPGTVGLGGQRVPIRVPRVRSIEGGEIPLRCYEAVSHGGEVKDLLLKRVLYGISCRNYEAAAEAIPVAIGLSSSTVSRGFVQASAAKLREMQERDLTGEDVVALFLDGKTFAEATMVVALGITLCGEKRFLGFVETDTENAQVLTPFLRSLLERRCCTARSKSLTSLCRLQSHPAQYVSGIPSAAILLSISHPIRCSTRCLANVRARISGPMIAL